MSLNDHSGAHYSFAIILTVTIIIITYYCLINIPAKHPSTHKVVMMLTSEKTNKHFRRNLEVIKHNETARIDLTVHVGEISLQNIMNNTETFLKTALKQERTPIILSV